MATRSLPRITVHPDGHFLMTERGEPFFWLGDTAWELFHRLNRSEAVRYFANRQDKRFTVIQAVILAEFDGLNAPNAYGERPLVDNDPEAANELKPLVDLFEVRIDHIGESWRELVRQLGRPWIACNRHPDEGGKWKESEQRRTGELLKAVELGAGIVDLELRTENLEKIIPVIKKRAKCLLSLHDLEKTPPLDELKAIVRRQLAAGADICKVITTGRDFTDNLTVLQLIGEFPEIKIVSFAMGPPGHISRVLCPLLGGDFTYVPDVANGCYRALATPSPENWIFNISTGVFYRLSEVAAALGELFPKAHISIGPGRHPYITQSPMRGPLDIGRAQKELSFSVALDLKGSLEHFIEILRQRQNF